MYSLNAPSLVHFVGYMRIYTGLRQENILKFETFCTAVSGYEEIMYM